MAVDMFLKLGTYEGETDDKAGKGKHAKEIDILAWSWGMSNSGTTHQGGGGGGGKSNVQDISCTKYIDKSSVNILQACFSGIHIPEAVLTVRKAGGKDTPVEYVVITMTEVLVTSVSTGGSGGEDRLTENLSLNFAKVKFEYTPQDATGKPGTAIPAVFDISGNVEE